MFEKQGDFFVCFLIFNPVKNSSFYFSRLHIAISHKISHPFFYFFNITALVTLAVVSAVLYCHLVASHLGAEKLSLLFLKIFFPIKEEKHSIFFVDYFDLVFFLNTISGGGGSPLPITSWWKQRPALSHRFVQGEICNHKFCAEKYGVLEVCEAIC